MCPSRDPRVNIHIFNVYNEVGTNTLSILTDAIGHLDSDDERIVLGDFNLYHPLWSITYRRAGSGPSAYHLLTIIEDFQLQLLTVSGTPTHRWKDGESTIDLTFASEELASCTIHCKIAQGLDCDSDHLPIDLIFNWNWQPAMPVRKRLWAKTDVGVFRQTVKDRLPLPDHAIPLTDKDSIDAFASSLIGALGVGIDASTPWANTCPHSIAGFD